MEANFPLTTLTQVLTLLRRYTGERKGKGNKNLQDHHHHLSSSVVNIVISVIGYLHIACIFLTRVRLLDFGKVIGPTRVYVPLRTPDSVDRATETILTTCNKTT